MFVSSVAEHNSNHHWRLDHRLSLMGDFYRCFGSSLERLSSILHISGDSTLVNRYMTETASVSIEAYWGRSVWRLKSQNKCETQMWADNTWNYRPNSQSIADLDLSIGFTVSCNWNIVEIHQPHFAHRGVKHYIGQKIFTTASCTKYQLWEVCEHDHKVALASLKLAANVRSSVIVCGC